ncbi:hypothetical protein L873DRAFT_922764 [Choiromyces venosus 120613-1]|uniref:Uncharacterized protein n=1 Tax=Choiromyces venosus 120613-1 TaxID=1336337 RepID=A0A3N4JRA3_9PEZI|nr:hypothetical protein L873DRAFT_922764 [Choiromyces venosus 120613-1]
MLTSNETKSAARVGPERKNGGKKKKRQSPTPSSKNYHESRFDVIRDLNSLKSNNSTIRCGKIQKRLATPSSCFCFAKAITISTTILHLNQNALAQSEIFVTLFPSFTLPHSQPYIPYQHSHHPHHLNLSSPFTMPF